MQILIRADASVALGTGHVMRCLTLANALHGDCHDISFVCRAHEGHLGAYIQAQGFPCTLLDADTTQGILGAAPMADAQATAALARDAGLVIVDHYALGDAWERAMPCPVMVIDDMFDQAHYCAVLLNQNFGVVPKDYQGLIPDFTHCLTGVQYALLRPEFSRARTEALASRKNRSLREILITLGGADADNATGWVLDALSAMVLPSEIKLTIVMGMSAPHIEQIKAKAAELAVHTEVLQGSDDMAGLMARADLAIGAAGSTSWERCALGLPTILVVLAENQRDIATTLAAAGAARLCSLWQSAELEQHLAQLSDNPGALLEMQNQAAAVCDGAGVQRVMQALYSCLDIQNVQQEQP